MVLVLVDAYIVLIFFKTVFLVISFSMIHGLLFLPIVLMIIIPQTRHKKEPMKVSFTCSSQLNKVVKMSKSKESEDPPVYTIKDEEHHEEANESRIPASSSIVNKVITPDKS